MRRVWVYAVVPSSRVISRPRRGRRTTIYAVLMKYGELYPLPCRSSDEASTSRQRELNVMYVTTAKRRTTRDSIIDWRFWPRSAPSCLSATINNDTLLFLSLPTEIPQSHTAWSNGNDPEPVSVEDVVDVRRYAIFSCMPETTMTVFRVARWPSG